MESFVPSSSTPTPPYQFNQKNNQTAGSHKGYSKKKWIVWLQIIYNISLIPLIFAVISPIVNIIKGEPTLDGIAVLTFPLVVMLLIGGIIVNIKFAKYGKNSFENFSILNNIRFIPIVALTIIFGMSYIVYRLVSLPGDLRSNLENKKYEQIMELVENEQGTYNDCKKLYGAQVSLNACALKVLSITGDIKGCVQLSAELGQLKNGSAYRDGIFDCPYKGEKLYGSLYYDQNELDRVISDIDEKKIQETKKIAEQETFKVLWQEINNKYDRVFPTAEQAVKESVNIGCSGYHIFDAQTSQGVVEVYQPCITYKDFLQTLESLDDFLFLKEINSQAVDVFLTTEQALEFGANKGFNCTNYHTVHLENTSRGPINVYRICDSWDQYWTEYKRIHGL